MIEPRHVWVPPRASSLGAECIAFWDAAGGSLFGWQEFVIDGMLGLDKDGRWASTNDGLEVARQNGKGVVLQAIEAFLAFEFGIPHGYKVVMHTAHEFATSLEHQLRLEEFIQNAPHLHAKVRDRGGYMHGNGRESINLKNGTRIIFKARTRGGGRGYSGDLLVWDEAMEVPDTVIAAQKPTLRASAACHGAKTIYAGSAVDQEVHAHGVPFTLIRERGLAKSPKVSWFEFSAPFEHPSELTEDLMRDRRFWHLANPSMVDGLIAEETMADEIETMPARVAAVELLGVADRPRTDGRLDTAISVEAWDSLVANDSQLEPPYSLAFDVSPERRTSIALAGRNQRGSYHVEIQESRQGTAWVAQRISDMYDSGDVYDVVYDGVGPAASLLPALEELGVPVEAVNSNEHSQACGRLVDMVAERTLEHLGSSELRQAVLGASTRPLGDAWAWSRKNSSVDISPLVAATLALGAVAGVMGGPVEILF